MEVAVLTALFLLGAAAEHVYVQEPSEWLAAQNHCRHHYIDLYPITSWRKQKRLRKATSGKVKGKFWIGLYRNGQHWMWSGGGNSTFLPWDEKEPDKVAIQNCTSLCWDNGWEGWHNSPYFARRPFFCFNLIIPQYKRTWEQALQYCRKRHTTLASLASETEHLLARRKMQQDSSERVWIGLRFLADQWLWMDKERLKFEAWPEGDQDHQCPMLKRCGTLTKEGVWESWDCQDKLNFLCY